MADLIERTPQQWHDILVHCGVSEIHAAANSQAFATVLVPGAFSAGEDELDDFLGQILHESDGLARLRENMNYSARRLREIGFAAKEGTRWRAAALRADTLAAGGPEAVANFLYAARMGNGDERSGDGWRYRGGAHIMITGLEAYRHAAAITGVDLVGFPERIEDPETALRASLAWWEGNVPDGFINDIVKTTKRVQGGDLGIAHRRFITEAATAALEAFA